MRIPYGLLVPFVTWFLTPAIASADILYVDYSRGRGIIDRFDSSGVRSQFTTSANNGGTGGSSTLLGLAFDPSGNLWAARSDTNNLQKFSPSGAGTIISATKTVTGPDGPFVQNLLNGPNGTAFDKAGNLYVANHNGNTITKIPPGGDGSTFVAFPSPGSSVNGLAFDSAGNLYASRESPDQVVKISPSGSWTVVSNGVPNPSGIAFDAAGNLYIAHQSSNTIERITPAGVASVFASTGLSNPGGLAFDEAGNLYVANVGGASVPNAFDQTIVRFTPNGTASVFASGLSNFPLDLAFTNDAGVPLSLPIPEPCAAALLCVGLPMLLRQRKR